MAGLRWRDLDLKENTVVLFSRFTGEARAVKLPERLIPLLRLGRERCAPNEFILSGAREGKPMTTRSLQLTVRQVARQAGLEQTVTAFHLRNTFAVHYLEQGGTVRELQRALGLEFLQAAMRYHAVANPFQSNSQPVEVEPMIEGEVIVTPPFPVNSEFSFMDTLRTHLRGRFLAFRAYFNSA